MFTNNVSEAFGAFKGNFNGSLYNKEWPLTEKDSKTSE